MSLQDPPPAPNWSQVVEDLDSAATDDIIFNDLLRSTGEINPQKGKIICRFFFIYLFYFFFFLRDFIFKKTLFEKLQYLKQEQ